MTQLADTPPQNLEAEENILGAVMLSAEALDVAVETVSPGDFYRSSHGVIFQTMIDLAETSSPIEPITVADALETSGKLDQVGGKRRIQEIAALVPSSRNVAHYAKIVKTHSAARQLITAGQNITRLGYERPGEVDDLMAQAEEALSAATGSVTSASFEPLSGILTELGAEIRASLDGNPLRGLLTGYTTLDYVLTGLHPGQLIVVAARPGAGKSALAQNIAENVADRESHVAFATLEMGRKELGRRGAARASGVDYNRIVWGNPPEGTEQKLKDAWKTVTKRYTHLHVNDDASLNPTTLRAHLRKLMRRVKVELLAVDYIQLMTSGQEKENKTQEVAAITRALKILAKDLQIPVIALSQMSRAIDHRAKEERRPQLSDLRDSGAIEQDADVVIFIHRPPATKEEDKNKAELIVAKNRNGQTSEIEMVYVGRKYSFSEVAKGVTP